MNVIENTRISREEKKIEDGEGGEWVRVENLFAENKLLSLTGGPQIAQSS